MDQVRPKFFIEQIAIAPPDPERAKQLLADMAGATFVEDRVSAVGVVFGRRIDNSARLSFDYTLLDNAREFEVLKYEQNEDNWLGVAGRGCSVSHFGMHCTEAELVFWRNFFAARGIDVAQEVNTVSHTNPAIAGKRLYNYVIFDTRLILGVDIKFIVRRDIAQ